jgi:hypothetical protein
MKKIWQISVYSLIVLGTIHVVCTPLFYHKFNVDAMWFVSCGLMLIFQAFVNILAWQLKKTSGYLFALFANITSLFLVLALLWILGEIQDYIGVIMALIVLFGSISQWKKDRTVPNSIK